MDLVMILLIGFGLALDVFGIAVAQGSVLGDVKGKNLVLMCLILCAWQIVALAIGYGISDIPNIEVMPVEVRMVWTWLSALIFIAEGGIKLYLIYHKKAMPEERSEINLKRTCGIAASTSIYTLFAGIGCGFVGLNKFTQGIALCVITIALGIAGFYIGYRNGELDKRIYWLGGILLIAAGAFVIAGYMIWYFGR